MFPLLLLKSIPSFTPAYTFPVCSSLYVVPHFCNVKQLSHLNVSFQTVISLGNLQTWT